jgi:hypothetical protein
MTVQQTFNFFRLFISNIIWLNFLSAAGLRTPVIWLLGSLLLLGGATSAQAAGYTPSITTAFPQLAISPSAPQVNWVVSTATCTVPSRYNVCDDGVSNIMPIGFTFTFAGSTYNNWSISTNGVIFFETGSSGNSTGNTTYTPSNLPTTIFGGVLGPPSTVHAALMPFWADLQKNASANNVLANNDPSQLANASFYQYQMLIQPSGAQVLVIQLKNVKYWNSNPIAYVNLQVQLWSTGEIIYSYGNMQVMTSNPNLRIGLQYPGAAVGCNTLANNQSTSLSNQSYLYTWDSNASACPTIATVNHYEIREDGAATLCAEPVTVLACSSSTKPCPTTSIINTQIINAAITVTGTGTLGTPNINPVSFNMQPTTPTQAVNLTWVAGSAGTATLGIQAAVSASGALVCTNVAGTAAYANCNMTVANTSCTPPPHHYEIQGSANGTICASSTFTIKAWADAAQTIVYTAAVATGTLTQSGNPASLPNLGAFTIPAGSSTVNITPISFPAAGTTTFSTTATPALVGAQTCNFGGSTSCAFPVVSCVTDFNCVETTANAAIPADSNSTTGRLYTKLAGTPFSFDVVARKADGTVATTYASDADKPVTVELVDGSGATACASRTNLTTPTATSQTLTFLKIGQSTDQGRKSVTFTVPNAYSDVRCRVTDNTTTMLKGCSLDDFAIRPTITLGTNANALAPSATALPVIKAGAAFNLQASSSATNYTGTLTQQGTNTAQDPTQTITQAAGGTVGTMTPASLTTNASPTPTNNATYSEVGYLYLGAGALSENTSSPNAFANIDIAGGNGGDCISTSGAAGYSNTLTSGKYGCYVGNTSVSLGRFQPAYFTTTVTPGCSGFTYAGSTTPARAGQTFSVKVTAQNATGGATTNYRNLFALSTTISNAGDSSGLTGNTIAAGTSLASAFAVGSATASSVTYTTATPQMTPLTLTMRAVDVDSTAVSSAGQTPSAEGTSPIRSGRAKILNAYGSELLDLPMTFTTQYWNGSAWVLNTSDSCTTPVNLSMTDVIATDTLAPANLCVWDTGKPGNSGIGCLTAGTAGKQFKEPPVANASASPPTTNGNFNLNVKAPGAGITGSVDVTATVPSWLQYIWSGAILSGPKGRATFGVYKTSIIYMRENF